MIPLHIAITKQDGGLVIMQLNADRATDEFIAATIAKAVSSWSPLPGFLPVKGWRRMGDDDITAYRSFAAAGLKYAMIDDGRAIVIDPARRLP